MKISVIIPTYDRKHTLERAIESVLSQTLKAAEIIVVDDGSSDGTEDWLKNRYPAITVLSQSNMGVSGARNAGIQFAREEWVAFLDSDDEWFFDKLEKQSSALEKNPGILFCHTSEIWIRNGVRVNQMKKHKKYGGMIFNNILDMCRVSPSSVLLNKSILEHVGCFNEELKVCEDYDLWLRIASKYPILFLELPLRNKFGGHRGQLSKVADGIEKYRIQSLESILSSTPLSKSQFEMARNMLLYKLNIYGKGLKNRNKKEAFLLVQKKIQSWTSIIN